MRRILTVFGIVALFGGALYTHSGCGFGAGEYQGSHRPRVTPGVTSLYGIVREAKSGAPIHDASVTFEFDGKTISAQSLRTGQYVLLHMPRGRIGIVRVTKEGYTSYQLAYVQEAEEYELDVSLEPLVR